MGSSLLNLLYYLQNLYDVANSWRRHRHDAQRQIQNVQENSKRLDSIDSEQLMTHDLLHGGTITHSTMMTMRTARRLRFLRLSVDGYCPISRINVGRYGKSSKIWQFRAFSSSGPPPSDDKPEPTTSTWVEEYLPLSVQPYARLARMDKPIGTFLLLWPCWWSTALAANHSLPDAKLLGLFGIGTCRRND